jgi:hypothetical protein
MTEDAGLPRWVLWCEDWSDRGSTQLMSKKLLRSMICCCLAIVMVPNAGWGGGGEEEEEEKEEEEDEEKEKVEKCLHSATGEALRHRSSLSFVVCVFVDVSTSMRTISCNQNAASHNGDWHWVSHEQLPPVVAEYVVGYLIPLVLISLHLCLVLLSDLSDHCKHFAHRTAIQVGRLH